MTAQPQPASSGILIRGERLLLVRRRNPPAADMYAFPGGRAEPGETSEETAIREFAEETGIAVRNPELFSTYDLKTIAPDGSHSSHFLLSVFLVDADPEAEAEAADDADAADWFTLEAIRALPVPSSVLECVEKLAENGNLRPL